MANSAPRYYPSHFVLHYALEQSYNKEARDRTAFYQEQKAKEKGLAVPRRERRHLPEFYPNALALKIKLEEQEKTKRIREEIRRSLEKDDMKPVDPELRYKLYDGVSRDQQGRYDYLKERQKMIPEKRYNCPIVSSWNYGWKTTDERQLYNRPSDARISIVQSSFYSRNGIPRLLRDRPEVTPMSSNTH